MIRAGVGKCQASRCGILAASMAPGISLPRLKSHIETLATYGRNPDGRGITRSCWSPAHEEARGWLLGKMKEAGLVTRIDPAGNTFGVLPGEGAAVLTGSHIDTVPEGGPLDGALGVLAGLECLLPIREGGLPVGRGRRAAHADGGGGGAPLGGAGGVRAGLKCLLPRGKARLPVRRPLAV